MQFHSCHSKENAVQFASQHVFWIICWHPKEPFVASTASLYHSFHYSFALLPCQWLEEEEDRKEELHMSSRLSPFTPERCQGLAQQLQDLPKCKCWDSGQTVLQTRDVNNLLHLERGNETNNSTAHFFSGVQANFQRNREKNC